MPQEQYELPRDIVYAYRREIGKFLVDEDQYSEEIKNAPLTGLPVFSVTIPEVAAGDFGEEPGGWRVMALTEDRTHCLAVADISIETRRPEVVSLLRNNGQSRPAEAFFRLYNRAQSGHDGQLKLLEVPALLQDAFWLTGATDEEDEFIPLPGPENQDSAKQRRVPYLKLLRELIPQFLPFDNPPGKQRFKRPNPPPPPKKEPKKKA